MAYIDDTRETGSGLVTRVRVPSDKGGADRNIYLDGRYSGYKLGQNNDRVYTISGREVASSINALLASM